MEAIAEYEAVNGQCRGGDLASHFSVSHATVTETIGRLREAGLVQSKPYGPITLTTKGRKLAKKSKERHEIVLAFLLSLGVTDKVAATDAEGIEHHVSDETLDCFRRHLDQHL